MDNSLVYLEEVIARRNETIAEQAERIAELETDKAQMRSMIIGLEEGIDHPWIPVSERLPENGGEVLTGYYSSIELCVFNANDNKFYDSNSCWTLCTHWMPLPTPPTIEGNTDG